MVIHLCMAPSQCEVLTCELSSSAPSSHELGESSAAGVLVRDFLGAILGTGIERSKVGDIIIMGETGAQILVAAELVEHFEQSLTQVRPLLGSVKASCSEHSCMVPYAELDFALPPSLPAAWHAYLKHGAACRGLTQAAFHSLGKNTIYVLSQHSRIVSQH